MAAKSSTWQTNAGDWPGVLVLHISSHREPGSHGNTFILNLVFEDRRSAVADSTCGDAIVPKLLLRGYAQAFCRGARGNDHTVGLHLQDTSSL